MVIDCSGASIGVVGSRAQQIMRIRVLIRADTLHSRNTEPHPTLKIGPARTPAPQYSATQDSDTDTGQRH